MLKKRKQCLLVFNLAFIILMLIYNMMFSMQTYHIRSVFKDINEEKNLNRSTAIHDDVVHVSQESTDVPWKTIAFATDYWGNRKLWKRVFKRQLLHECDENRCHISLDRSDVNKADAVIFNGNDLRQKTFGFLEKLFHRKHKDENRHPDQIYVFFTFEAPPVLQNIHLESYNDYFNWTMTYRADSDVVVPYGKVYQRKYKRPSSDVKYVTQGELSNRKIAIWMASHCPTQSRREDLVKELQRFMPVDTYGSCGSKTCGKRTTIRNIENFDDDPCVALFGNYSFYLALENALCKDYVTEKLYRALKLGIIPVVLGGVNFTALAPPKSFINFFDFDTIADLAEYLKVVASDANRYNEYLKWQEDYDVELGSPYKPFVCDLCKKLHSRSIGLHRSQNSYSSIRDWYMKRACYKLKED